MKLLLKTVLTPKNVEITVCQIKLGNDNDWGVSKNLEGNSHGLLQGIVPAFTWTDKKETKTSVRTAGNLAKILTGYLSNTSLGVLLLHQPVQ
jgi:hypothetical protein